MDLQGLKNEIIDNPTLIPLILKKLNFVNIKEYKNEFRCGKDEDSDVNGVSIKKDSLLAMVRSSSKTIKGDIFTIVQEIESLSFKDSVYFVLDAIGKSKGDFGEKQQVILPFGGYYKSIKNGDSYVELEIYDESILEDFIDIPSRLFLRDGIDLEAQNFFKVMYDVNSNRIAVPWRTPLGEIVGIMGRYNSSTDYINKNKIAKWFPILKFPKSQTIFGYYENYSEIVDKKLIFVGESEKFPMQLRSMKSPIVDMATGEIKEFKGINLGLAVGSHSISHYQCSLIQSCYPETVIIAFDEGLNFEEVEKEAIKLKSKLRLSVTKVGFIWDDSNTYLPKGSKSSPSDFGLEVFHKLIKECTIWVN